MLNRVLIAIAVFTAVAAYQFGYYQGRLSVSADEQAREALYKTVYAKTARVPQALPPVTQPIIQDVKKPNNDHATSSEQAVVVAGE